MLNIEYRIIKNAEKKDLLRLYKEADWWKEEDDKHDFLLELIVKKTFCFIGAFHQEKMIGMGRAISDGVSDAYIQDVTVLKDFRRKGIGGKIIKELVTFLKSQKINWIGLIGEPGTKKFYSELGFKTMEDYIPMLFKKD